MKRKGLLNLVVVVFAVFILLGSTSCSKVPAGHVGIKFYLLGGDKGIDYDELGPGFYWIGMYKELYLFPTFTQNHVWTQDVAEGSKYDESFTFQDREGLELNADIGITYYLIPTHIPKLFETYKRGIDEITDTFLRNMVRDALVSRASQLDIDKIYGTERAALLDSVHKDVQRQVEPLGIVIERLYWIGSVRLPESVKQAIDMKIRATQTAIQRENEIRQAQAEAQKKIAEAEGRAKSLLLEAQAQAEANRILAASITQTLVEYEKVIRWDGVLPQMTGGVVPMVNIK